MADQTPARVMGEARAVEIPPPGGRRPRPTQLAQAPGSAAAVAAAPPGQRLRGREAVRQHAARVHSQVRRLLNDEAGAEAVTRQVLLHVLRRPDTCRSKGAFTAWLHRATINTVLAHRRRLPRPSPREP
jgi:DNA-directed RNA polymerase specialized sigma24 family protein